MQSSTDMISKRHYQLSFSDEFDEATFDLSGRAFQLDFVSVQTWTIGQVTSRLYEFAFTGEPIQDRAGIAVLGNLFIGLSTSFESSDGPWGARVLALDASGEIVPIGRAQLAVSS